jgi:hypothetical protein
VQIVPGGVEELGRHYKIGLSTHKKLVDG